MAQTVNALGMQSVASSKSAATLTTSRSVETTPEAETPWDCINAFSSQNTFQADTWGRLGNFKDVESDGRRVNRNRDPPGQKCIYIIPGDPNKETYRLSTFHHFPIHAPVDPCLLAAHGFYYIGYRDRVKCFSCGQTSDNWLEGDDVTSSEWHASNCDFMNGRDTENIPISLLRHRQSITTNGETSQLSEVNRNSPASTDQHPATSGSIANGYLLQGVASGSNASSTSVNIGNSSVNNEMVVNQTHINNSQQNGAVGRNSRNESNSSPTSLNQQQHPQQNWVDVFPCYHPINPHMRSPDARLQTFLDNSTKWPAHRIRATPQQIVDAGMYYLGQRDRVKCWYCNGGLQNWDQEDDPWEEHAKWFPLCEFVLQQKGPEFVHRIVSQCPGLERPPINNPAVQPAAAELLGNGEIRRIEFGRPQPQQNSSPVVIDSQKLLQQRNKKIEEEMKTSEIVAQARLMGFDDQQIKEAYKKILETNGEMFSSVRDLVDVLVSLDDDHELTAMEEQDHCRSNSKPASNASALQPSALNEVKKLEESKKCKKCLKNDACVVFIPCGHLISCVECADTMKRCLICKEVVRQKVRSFIS